MRMFKRKQDVDKHITSILSRKRDEKERQAQGFQIARLYYDIKEYATAKRYLSGFLFVRENVPAAHQLMGEINEALGEKEEAIENYKRALNLGSYGSSNKQLVLKICELYCEQGTDIERMKYWCEQCEKFYPRNDIVFKLKTQIAEASNEQNGDNSKDIEELVVSELINRPTDLKLRIKLLTMYMESDRHEEAYDTVISTDLTTAFVDRLPWFEFVDKVFKTYGEKFPDSKTDLVYNQHLLHVLRNITYLSMGGRNLEDCVKSLQRFDRQLKLATSLTCQEEEWVAVIKEMKGQLFFLAGLVLLKRAQAGTIEWKEVDQLSGACFLASRSINPIDCQAPWFVRSPQGRAKFNNWWYLQSYDRLSQVGHMLQQLAQNDVIDWSRKVRQSVMTAKGHQRIFSALYATQDLKTAGDISFLYQANEMVDSSDSMEPLTERLMIDIDRVAHQVHLSSLTHLVWLCLQRYTNEMDTQPYYHFNILENIQFSTKNIETGAAESLCQLDILVFLLATTKCAASAVADKSTAYEDRKERLGLLPVCLSRPLCTQDQEEWWNATYKFCTNTVKDDFSRLRRTLIRGLETVRLIGPHGMSMSMIAHIARSLDARAKSLRQAEHGCRCPLNDLIALEARATFYWEKAKQTLLKLQRNHQTPVPKNRLFKEVGDTDVPPRLVDKFFAEATFALSVAAMKDGQYEVAIQGFEGHRSVWAKFYCAQIYRILADKESENEDQGDDEKRQALVFKARDFLFDVMDMLDGDKAHELNILVSRELDELETKIHDLELSNVRGSIFYTPAKSPAPLKNVSRINGVDHSTPRNLQMPSLSSTCNGPEEEENTTEINQSIRDHSLAGESRNRPRPSPERLDLQIKSLSYSQASLFKMVMDRNEELIMINGKMMEELHDNNNQLKSVLTENKNLMEELKTFLGENRDMMKQIKMELTSLKPGLLPTAGAQVSPATPLFVSHMSTPSAPHGPFPAFPPPAPVMPMGYSNFPSSVPTQPPVGNAPYCPSGLPGMKSSNVGKYRQQSDEDEEEEEDLSNIDEASAMYREYLDAEQSYSQYFTPEAQMLDLSHTGAKSGIESHPPLSMPPFQPRMSIPAGYFASALRGQTLQYSPASQTPGQVKPTPGPGFFSTPPSGAMGPTGIMTSTAVRMPLSTTTPLLVVATPPAPADTAQPSVLMTALTGQRAITTGFTKPEVTAVAPPSILGPASSGVHSLFYAKATLEPKRIKGEITVLVDSSSNQSTILMMGETKDILFHHNIHSLKLETSFQPTQVIWMGVKAGSVDQERIVVSFENTHLATQLKETIQKAAALCQPKSSPQQASNAASTKPIVFSSNINATSTPVTNGTTKAPLFGLSSTSKETGKFSFGGLTFTSSPSIATGAENERAKIEAHKQSSAAASKSETPKPFAGFSLTTKSEVKLSPQSTSDPTKTAPASTAVLTNQKPLGAISKSPGSIARSPGGGEDERVEEYEPNVDFKPVISLPELVEKKTGEENETEVFVDKCRLFRFDPETKQWKERGVGEMKILRSKDQVRFRIVMRREQILKLCANHFLSPEMKLTPMASSDRAWCYFAMDFSEEEIKHEHLAVKFKSAEKAKAFEEKFNESCKKLREDCGSSGTTSAEVASMSSGVSRATTEESKEAQKPSVGAAAISGASSTDNKSLSSIFKPKAGSWECSGCLIRNDETVVKCPACNTSKPGSKPATSAGPSLTEMFKPKTGSWECSGCLIRNDETVVKCPACNTSKPGSKPATSAGPSLTEMFKPKTGSWECGSCLVRNNEDLIKCVACGNIKPGAKLESAAKEKPSTGFIFSSKATTGPTETGFKFGAATTSSTLPSTGGFVFNSSVLTAASTSATIANTSGFIFKSPAVSTSVCGVSTVGVETFKFGAVTTASSINTTTAGFIFKAPAITAANTATTTTTSSVTSTSGFVFKPSSTATPATTGSTIFQTPISIKPSFVVGTSTSSTPSSTSSVTSNSTVTTTSPAGFNFGTAFSMTPAGKVGPSTKATPGSGGLLAKLLTSDDSAMDETVNLKPKPTAGFNFTMPPKTTATPGSSVTSTATASSQGFQFSFTKSPTVPVVPGSPEVDEHGMYVNKEGDDSHIHFEPVVSLPAKIEIKTGEEDEDILFESRAKLYRFVGGEWKEKGVGVVKILRHKDTKKTRILMRRDQILKICCNHMIEPTLSLQSMAKSEGKAWVWYALDFSEDESKIEQFAIRFRTTDTATEFQKVFDQCRDSAGTSPHKVEPPSHQGQGDTPAVKKELFKDTHSVESPSSDNDVIYVGEDKPTQDQLARARKYLLPDTFYLYENKPPCPGCIGCEDEGIPTSSPAASKPGRSVQPKEVARESAKDAAKESSKVKEQAAQDKPVFGASAQDKPLFGASSNLPDFASLTSDGPPEKANGGFLFGSGTSVDFSSLAETSKISDFTWNKASSSSTPFKFAGAGQKLFGGVAGGGGDDGGHGGDEADGEDSGVLPSDDIHFEPVIPLPDLVKVKTGEEDWTPLFCHRAKLYKFDTQVSQWKERGVGDIKLLSHNTKTMFRVLQRREQVLKVSCNHLITVDMELKPMATSETSWCWIANDLTETQPTIEQFAVKFKAIETAVEFKTVFENCQEKLKLIASERFIQESSLVSSNTCGTRSKVQSSLSLDIAMRDAITSTKYNPPALQIKQWERKMDILETNTLAQLFYPEFEDKGNIHHIKAFDVAGCDTNVATSYPQLGDKGNIYHTKALDVAGYDTAVATSYPQLGDKGNIYHTKALDVAGYDTAVATSYPQLGDKGNIYHTKALDVAGYDTAVATSYPQLGDKGNIYHTKALDVAGYDTAVATSYPQLGDKGNIYHTKALDVAGYDTVVATSYPQLGDKGNIYHTKALDVVDQDTMSASSCTPLGGKQMVGGLTSKSVIPLGDKGNIYHTKALDVAEQDTMSASSCTPLGGKQMVGGLTSKSVIPLGDKGNIYHTKALDVAEQDTMSASSCTPLGGKQMVGGPTSASVIPLGDKGNIYHTKALDVAEQDTISASSCTPLGGKQMVGGLTSASVTPLGDKGNIYHTKALDVAEQDTMSASSCTPLGGKQMVGGLTSKSVIPLGDKGNIYHTKALDVAEQDTMSASSCTPLGGKQMVGGLTSKSVIPLGDKGNIYHTKALDVAEQDTMSASSCTPLGGKQMVGGLTSASVTPLGDKGNIYHTKALDVAEQDTMSASSCTQLGGKQMVGGLTSASVTPLGDKGNIYHTKALDVAEQDTMSASSCTPLGGKQMVGGLTSKSVIPLGDKGNIYHTKALDVAEQDTMSASSCTPLGGKQMVGGLTSKSVIPLGDKGNIYHTKTLDVAEQDTMSASSCTPLGGKQMVGGLTSASVTPLGDKGNIYHTKALDVAEQDTMSASTFSPLGKSHIISALKTSNVGHQTAQEILFHAQALNIVSSNSNTTTLTSQTGEQYAHSSCLLDSDNQRLGSDRQSLTVEQPKPALKKEQQQESSFEQQKQQAEAAYEDGDEDGADDEDYKEEEEGEESDEDEVLYEKRVTLCIEEDGQWKKLGTGNLQVTYNEDLNGNSINFIGDDGEMKCNHVICREHVMTLNQRNCEWCPIDYATDEPLRKHFMATFSSTAAAEEFATIFNEGQRLAMDSELSEVLPSEMDVPVIFSGGETEYKA